MHERAKKALGSFLKEDIGSGDITSALLPRKKVFARIVSRDKGIIAGTEYAREIFKSRDCKVKILTRDGSPVRQGQAVMTISGQAYAVLSCERTVLNLLSRMSGIATRTNLLVKIAKGENRAVDIYSTRKTAPGLRIFDKEAVETGGGKSYRLALDQMIMIKDNHLAIAPLPQLAERAKKSRKKFEVEVENLQDAITAAKHGAAIIMLDNRSPREISQITAALERLGLRKGVKIEASGGIDESNIRQYARSGADMISVGRLTSAVCGLDLSLEVS